MWSVGGTVSREKAGKEELASVKVVVEELQLDRVQGRAESIAVIWAVLGQ
jgi:hypothetical protein